MILLAFARITWQLGSEDLWWDESLTLQRAESAWLPLLQNHIVLSDGVARLTSIDQHPFFYFLVQGLLLRIAGDEEFALRFVSAAAATLMVPVTYAFAALYRRRGVLPGTAPVWAALLTATSPFLLWFGQEARPYALWALLTVLSTYLLLRAAEPYDGETVRWPWIAGYAVTLLMCLSTHYYAVFLIPVHAVLIYRRLRATQQNNGCPVGGDSCHWRTDADRRRLLVRRRSSGGRRQLPKHLVEDTAAGSLERLQSRSLRRHQPRIAPRRYFRHPRPGGIHLGVALPTHVGGRWLGAGRHGRGPDRGHIDRRPLPPGLYDGAPSSLLAGPFIVLVGTGVGLAWRVRPWLAGLIALFLLAGSGYSTVNYFTQEAYAQDDFSRLGAELDNALAPGDLVLIKSPFAWRVFSYYQPKATVNGMPGDYAQIDVYGAPLLSQPWEETFAFLERETEGRRRIWLLVSGTQGHMDLEGRVENWLDDNLFKLRETTYFSQSSLKSHLYLPETPVYNAVPDTAQNPVDVVFGDRIRLAGYDVGMFPDTDLALPLTLYWQATAPTDRRYKYRIALVESIEDGSQRTVSVTEREPYDGTIPTIYWDPGKTIVEYGELPPGEWPQVFTPEDAERYRLTLEVYDAETLDKLPVTHAGGDSVAQDGAVAVLPYRPREAVPHAHWLRCFRPESPPYVPAPERDDIALDHPRRLLADGVLVQRGRARL